MTQRTRSMPHRRLVERLLRRAGDVPGALASMRIFGRLGLEDVRSRAWTWALPDFVYLTLAPEEEAAEGEEAAAAGETAGQIAERVGRSLERRRRRAQRADMAVRSARQTRLDRAVARIADRPRLGEAALARTEGTSRAPAAAPRVSAVAGFVFADLAQTADPFADSDGAKPVTEVRGSESSIGRSTLRRSNGQRSSAPLNNLSSGWALEAGRVGAGGLPARSGASASVSPALRASARTWAAARTVGVGSARRRVVAVETPSVASPAGSAASLAFASSVDAGLAGWDPGLLSAASAVRGEASGASSARYSSIRGGMPARQVVAKSSTPLATRVLPAVARAVERAALPIALSSDAAEVRVLQQVARNLGAGADRWAHDVAPVVRATASVSRERVVRRALRLMPDADRRLAETALSGSVRLGSAPVARVEARLAGIGQGDGGLRPVTSRSPSIVDLVFEAALGPALLAAPPAGADAPVPRAPFARSAGNAAVREAARTQQAATRAGPAAVPAAPVPFLPPRLEPTRKLARRAEAAARVDGSQVQRGFRAVNTLVDSPKPAVSASVAGPVGTERPRAHARNVHPPVQRAAWRADVVRAVGSLRDVVVPAARLAAYEPPARPGVAGPARVRAFELAYELPFDSTDSPATTSPNEPTAGSSGVQGREAPQARRLARTPQNRAGRFVAASMAAREAVPVVASVASIRRSATEHVEARLGAVNTQSARLASAPVAYVYAEPSVPRGEAAVDLVERSSLTSGTVVPSRRDVRSPAPSGSATSRSRSLAPVTPSRPVTKLARASVVAAARGQTVPVISADRQREAVSRGSVVRSPVVRADLAASPPAPVTVGALRRWSVAPVASSDVSRRSMSGSGPRELHAVVGTSLSPAASPTGVSGQVQPRIVSDRSAANPTARGLVAPTRPAERAVARGVLPTWERIPELAPVGAAFGPALRYAPVIAADPTPYVRRPQPLSMVLPETVASPESVADVAGQTVGYPVRSLAAGPARAPVSGQERLTNRLSPVLPAPGRAERTVVAPGLSASPEAIPAVSATERSVATARPSAPRNVVRSTPPSLRAVSRGMASVRALAESPTSAVLPPARPVSPAIVGAVAERVIADVPSRHAATRVERVHDQDGRGRSLGRVRPSRRAPWGFGTWQSPDAGLDLALGAGGSRAISGSSPATPAASSSSGRRSAPGVQSARGQVPAGVAGVAPRAPLAPGFVWAEARQDAVVDDAGSGDGTALALRSPAPTARAALRDVNVVRRDGRGVPLVAPHPVPVARAASAVAVRADGSAVLTVQLPGTGTSWVQASGPMARELAAASAVRQAVGVTAAALRRQMPFVGRSTVEALAETLVTGRSSSDVGRFVRSRGGVAYVDVEAVRQQASVGSEAPEGAAGNPRRIQAASRAELAQGAVRSSVLRGGPSLQWVDGASGGNFGNAESSERSPSELPAGGAAVRRQIRLVGSGERPVSPAGGRRSRPSMVEAGRPANRRGPDASAAGVFVSPGAEVRGQDSERPAWSQRTPGRSTLGEGHRDLASRSSFRDGHAIVNALARAETPEELARIIRNREFDPEPLRAALPSPAFQLVERLVVLEKMARQDARGEARHVMKLPTRGLGGDSYDFIRPAKAPQPATLLAKSAGTEDNGLAAGASRVTQLANKLLKLIHLAETEKRVLDARQQVRMSDSEPGAGAGSAAASVDVKLPNMKALKRELFDFVIDKLSMMEDLDGHSKWW